MAMEEVCYTREAALEKAIDMESKSFEIYKNGYLKVKDRMGRDLLKDLALDELKHRYVLEKAFFEETVALHDTGYATGPSMNLTMMLEERPLNESSTDQEIMIYSIHEEKRAVDFYKGMASQCGGAPMAEMYKSLAKDEENHLTRLEELYESQYMQEM